jgi:hypothetical protein
VTLDADPRHCFVIHEATPYTKHQMNYLSELCSATFTFEGGLP